MTRQTTSTRNFTRRDFLKHSGAAAAAITAAPAFIPSTVLAAPGKPGANERANIGVIGTGGRVTGLSNSWGDPAQMRFVGLTDCNAAHISKFVGAVKRKFPELETCNRYEDYREMLDKEKLDGVFITTPAHGRVLPCIHAAQAGVGMYAEKPVTLTIDEGHSLIEAVNKHDVTFQAGTQARSIAINDWVVAQLQGGKLGRVKKVEMANFNNPIDYKPLENAPAIPEGMNWDMWCNQAPLLPFDPKIITGLRGWAPYREFDGGGDMWGLTGFGTHAFDQVLWALGRETESPVAVRVHEPGNPHCAVTLQFADGLEIELGDKVGRGPSFGGIFLCENGKIEINRGRFATNPTDAIGEKPELASPHTGGATHIQNWLDGIRTGEATRCPVDVAHRQSVICHIVCVARDLGRDLRFDPAADRFVGDDEANRHPSVSRERRAGYELPS